MDLWPLVLLFLLILVGIPLIVAVITAVSARRAARAAAEARARLEAAEACAGFAVASVVSARTLAARVSHDLVRVTLRIEPPDGEAYTAVATWEVEPNSAHFLQPGQPLAVKINPDDPRQVFPNVTWARSSL